MVNFLTQITNYVLGKKCCDDINAEIERNKRIIAEFDAKCSCDVVDANVLLEYAEFLKGLRTCQTNYNKIVALYERGIVLGCCVAKMRLGEFYMENALESWDDFERGYSLLLELVKVGFIPACIALGNYYLRKQGNVVQTYYWYVVAMDLCKDDGKREECVKWLAKLFGNDGLKRMLERDGKEEYWKFFR